MVDGTNSSASQTWRERIAAQQAGGQSIRALCKQNGWHEHAFYWWRSRLGRSPCSTPRRGRKGAGLPRLAEVVVDRAATPLAVLAEPILFRLGGGRELVLPVSMTLEQVAKLAGLIEAKPWVLEVSR